MNGKLRNMTALYLSHGSKMLLLYRVGSRVVSPSWCGIGGHFEPHELNDAKACMLRELQEEIGLTEQDLRNLSLRYITLRLKNGEVRQNYYFFADLADEAQLPTQCAEGSLSWVPYEQLSALAMPLTAGHVLEHYLRQGRQTDYLYGGVTAEDGTHFSVLSEF